MTRENLFKEVDAIAQAVVADPRWRSQQDDLGVSVLGMILYGYAMAVGRTLMFLDVEDIDAAVLQVITATIGAAPKWSGGLVQEARLSALDRERHVGHFELIGVGHSYLLQEDRKAVVANIFSNLENFRR